MFRSFVIMFLSLFFIFSVYMENTAYFQCAKNRLQNRNILSPLLNFGKAGLILNKLGFDYIAPREEYSSSENKYCPFYLKIDKSKFTTRQGWEDPKNTPPEKMLSSTIMDPEEIDKGIPIISMVIDEDNLYGATGLFTNSFRRGRDWERLCFVSYFEKGKLQFATAAGVRIHGGSSRRKHPHSFRLYFRKRYGAKEFGVDIFSKTCKPLKRLVLHNDIRESHFSNPIAYDISRQAGCITASTKPVVLFLNGKRYEHGCYVLTEYIDKQFFKNHFGTGKFTYIRTQGEKIGREKNSNIYLPLKKWAEDKSQKMTMKRAGEKIDIENLTNWWIAQLICANSDHFQGVLLRKKNDPSSKWFWINWDMDRSFYNLDPDEKNRLENFWEQKIVLEEVINGITGKSRKDVRGIVFRRLYHEDSEYKDYFANKMIDTLNYKVTSNFLKSRIEYYKKTANSFEVNTDFADCINLFFKHRQAFLCQLMQDYFDKPRSYICNVKAPEGITFIVDGYAKTEYSGWYYKGHIITVKIKDEKYKNTGWLVNGKRVASKNGILKYRISGHTTIFPVVNNFAVVQK